MAELQNIKNLKERLINVERRVTEMEDTAAALAAAAMSTGGMKRDTRERERRGLQTWTLGAETDVQMFCVR